MLYMRSSDILKILLIGGGGREHALAWKLAQSPRVEKIYCAPGNPGIAAVAECVNIDVSDNAALGKFALDRAVDLTVVGPELPLTNGLVDHFATLQLKAFGRPGRRPSWKAQRLLPKKLCTNIIFPPLLPRLLPMRTKLSPI